MQEAQFQIFISHSHILNNCYPGRAKTLLEEQLPLKFFITTHLINWTGYLEYSVAISTFGKRAEYFASFCFTMMLWEAEASGQVSQCEICCIIVWLACLRYPRINLSFLRTTEWTSIQLIYFFPVLLKGYTLQCKLRLKLWCVFFHHLCPTTYSCVVQSSSFPPEQLNISKVHSSPGLLQRRFDLNETTSKF